MIGKFRQTAVIAVLAVSALLSCVSAAQTFSLESTKGLRPYDVTVEAVSYHGRKAVRVLPAPPAADEMDAAKNVEGGGIVEIQGTSFHNGTIEIDLTGKPRLGAPGDARGFVGLAFRVASDASKYECLYLRPTNGRADDQLRRNHSTQYVSMPDFPWSKLRKESPGQYESYVDLIPGEWTKIKIAVSDLKAQLYVNGSMQPVLIVNDLKLGDTQGGIALWIGMGTEAYFANLRISNSH